MNKIETIGNLQEGQLVQGIVKEIKPYGAFIELKNGVTGLAHIVDLSVSRIKSPEERLKIGQEVKVAVKEIDSSRNKIMLSYKDTLGTWEENVKNFKEKTYATGIVREADKNKNGVFIELTPNLVGMAEYKDNLKYGQEVQVYIKKINPEKKKIKLLIK